MNREEVKTLVEKLKKQKPSLVICGGGHIAYCLAKMADELDFDVTVIEDRVEYANRTRFPKAKVICGDVVSTLGQIENPEDCYFVITSRGQALDREYLETILSKGFTYVGMLGSKSKVALVMKDLKERGFDEALLEKVYAPVGIDIAAITPAEISISILAELIKIKNEDGAPAYVGTDVIEAIEKEEVTVIATIIEKGGSAPRGIGSMLVLKEDGTIAGTIGGGIVEYKIIERAKEIVGIDIEEELEFNVGAKGDQGMICGGRMKVRIESVPDTSDIRL